MTTCQILEIVLGLEMRVHEALLKVHKCATGLCVKDNVCVPEDPHVIYYVFYDRNFIYIAT